LDVFGDRAPQGALRYNLASCWPDLPAPDKSFAMARELAPPSRRINSGARYRSKQYVSARGSNMFAELFSVVEVAGQTLLKIVPITVALGIIFAALTHWSACNPGTPWWRKREIAVDLCYWFLIPLMARFVRIGLLVLGAALVFDIHGADALIAFYEDGFGPMAQLPLWLQAIAFVVASDVMLYWIHRAFHRGALWKYHAVHHSSEELDWISAARFHPANIFLGTVMVDVILLLAGISPNVMLIVGPFTITHSAFVHANLNWALGPLKYLIATPVFHRWHHTALDRGGSSNFAGTFPLLDILFGTYYMPENELPDAYGIADKTFPPGFGGQMLYPFRR
jgi:sterol desaturase/sphingolipid hydroxylase (fatty acid hydroxylase superfamily)